MNVERLMDFNEDLCGTLFEVVNTVLQIYFPRERIKILQNTLSGGTPLKRNILDELFHG